MPTTTEEPTTTEAPVTTTSIALTSLVPTVIELGSFAVTEVPVPQTQPMCPEFDQFDGVNPTNRALRTFLASPVLGPFVTLGIFEFPDGEADAFLDNYLEGASGPCVAYETLTAEGVRFNLGWAEGSGPTYADRTITLEVRGDTNGFPVNSDVVLIRSENRVGFIGYVTTGGLPDALTRDSLAAAIASGLEGEAVALVDLPTTAGQIDAVLPSLDELDNVEVFNAAPFATFPDGLCPANPSNIGLLEVKGAAARRFFGAEFGGAEVLIAILELPDGGADTFIDRWESSANGACASYVDASGSTHRTSVAPGNEYLDRTLVVSRRAKLEILDLGVPKEFDSVTDTVLVRSGDYVGLLRYSLTTTDTPNVDTRNSMVEVLVAAIEELTG